MRASIRTLLSLLTTFSLASVASAGPPLVLAAASLQESLNAVADAWAAKHHERPVLSFAASSALAKQIDAGAPADLFISADEPWMNDVQKNGYVAPGTRVSFLANRLVLIAPADGKGVIAIKPGFPLAQALGDGRLAMADPESVPAGKYGKASLTALGVWPAVKAKVVSGDSVRSAMAFVERGEAPYGIVYATDALASKAVRIVGVFPEASHAPITYPIARLTASTSRDAEQFRLFVISAQGRAIFRKYGFLAHSPSVN
ncbi:molybdate ABC transporter substrate-binding protein [Sphingomonas abietis]|uniref:Molybdate ABC transporter substrate-binding protein n=1 Tax=Sphingomonas abietis TaxID=3012344 RepID=A0ABY7NR62_9SPHN|nr:molybdate ABC transporter substrate-binding protein [Sphingomonas abietis]WBO24025.1 molybdate ABC transporter substrate-binding protein [Sphingomonas abietis]